MRPNKVKRALNDGKIQIGTWITTFRKPQIVQVLATAGFGKTDGAAYVKTTHEETLLLDTARKAVSGIRI